MCATSCMLVAFISQVLCDFDTYGLVRPIVVGLPFLYMLYVFHMDDICGVTTRYCGFAFD